MAGKKLDLVKETLSFMLQQLKPEDSLSLVTYCSHVTVNIPLAKVDADRKNLIQETIDSLKATTSTNLSGGLLAGLKQLVERKK